MPRGPRLNVLGTLHYVIVLYIEKHVIIDDDKEREDFVTRIGSIALRLINEHDVSLAKTAERLDISTSALAQILSDSKRS